MSESISIIIVNYCTRDLLRNCLASLRTNALLELNIFVVDNNSSDGSVAMVQAEFPEVRLIINCGNVGFAKANNQAIRESVAKYVLLLNSDTVIPPGALQMMLQFVEQHPEVGAVSPRLRSADGSIQRTVRRTNAGTGLMWLFWRLSGLGSLVPRNHARHWIRRYLGFALGRTLRAYLDSYESSLSPMEVETLSGACLLLRRRAVDDVGLLDEHFFMYMEDIDYCMRLAKAGWKLYYLPAAEIIHLGEQSSGGRMRKYKVEAYRSLFYFYRKHCPAWKLVVARIIVLVAFSLKWIRSFVCTLLSTDNVYHQNCSDIAKILHLCYRWRDSQQTVAITAYHDAITRTSTSIANQQEKEHLRA